MIRGTTPTLIFNITDELDFDLIDNVNIIIYSLDRQITKGLDDVELDAEARRIALFLSQEETLSFSTGRCDVQVRLLLKDGTAMASKSFPIVIDPILEEKVIEPYE